MSLSVKADLNGDVRRLPADVVAGSYLSLISHLKNVYSLHASSSFTLKYLDEENESITMATQTEWEESKQIAKENGMKTMKVYVYTAPSSSSSVSSPVSPLSSPVSEPSSEDSDYEKVGNEENSPVSSTSSSSVTVEDEVEEEIEQKDSPVKQEVTENVPSSSPGASVQSETEKKEEIPDPVIPEEELPLDTQIIGLIISLLSDSSFKASLPSALSSLVSLFANQEKKVGILELLEEAKKLLPEPFASPLVQKYLSVLSSKPSLLSCIDAHIEKARVYLSGNPFLLSFIQPLISSYLPLILSRLEQLDIPSVYHALKEKVLSAKKEGDERCEIDLNELIGELPSMGGVGGFDLSAILPLFSGGCPALEIKRRNEERQNRQQAQPSSAPSSSSSSSSLPLPHPNVRCDLCSQSPILGIRYQCQVCFNYDLCADCEASGKHDSSHPLLKIHPPSVVEEREKKAPSVHEGVACDACRKSPIVGVRYKCQQCSNFDLCEECEKKGVEVASHLNVHPMLKMNVPSQRGDRCGRGRGGGGWRGWRRPHCGAAAEAPSFPHLFPWGHHGMRQERSEQRERQGGCAKTNNNAASSSVSSSSCTGTPAVFCTVAAPASSSSSPSVPTYSSSSVLPSARFVSDITFPDRSTVYAGQTIVKTWTLQNSGSSQWPEGTKLIFLRGSHELLQQEEFDVKRALPGDTVEVSAVLNVPREFVGRATAFFRLADKDRKTWGPRVWCDLLVDQAANNPENKKEEKVYPSVVPVSQSLAPSAPEKKEEKASPAPVASPASAPSLPPFPTPSYEKELDALAVLGFSNRQLCSYLLREHKGNVQAVANWLLENAMAAK